jgi:hypothetical protein
MTLRTLRIFACLIATLAEFTISSALATSAGTILTVAVVTIITNRVPATMMVREERGEHQGAREARLRGDRRSAARADVVVAVDDCGRARCRRHALAYDVASGTVFTSEVVAAKPPSATRDTLSKPRALAGPESSRQDGANTGGHPWGTVLTVRAVKHTGPVRRTAPALAACAPASLSEREISGRGPTVKGTPPTARRYPRCGERP